MKTNSDELLKAAAKAVKEGTFKSTPILPNVKDMPTLKEIDGRCFRRLHKIEIKPSFAERMHDVLRKVLGGPIIYLKWNNFQVGVAFYRGTYVTYSCGNHDGEPSQLHIWLGPVELFYCTGWLLKKSKCEQSYADFNLW